jgi:NADH-quinone oxidoreductase subunit F
VTPATARWPETKVLSANFGERDSHLLATVRPRGAWKTFERVVRSKKPAEVVDEVKRSRLRGRGGAGFPTGVKWSFVAKGTGKPTFVVVNADESEPGTFKDRWLMERDPHLVLEGAMLCAFAVEASAVYVYVRGEYPLSIRRLEGAIEEARRERLVGKDVLGTGWTCEVFVHPGAGAYICGEETGMLESLEGKRGHPRIKPPFPAVQGAFGCPTVINNVETLAHVPWILEHGGEAFARQGIPPDPQNPKSLGTSGTKLMGVSGQVRTPGVWEFEPGITLRELVYGYGGGPLPGRKVKAVIPGGLSMPVLRDDELDVKMGFDDLQKAGSGLGTGCAIVMDDSCDLVAASVNIAHFFADESCGQCTPCREGCHWLEKILERILEGHGTPADLDLMESLYGGIEGRTICALADAAVWPLRSILRKFRSEFTAKMAATPGPVWPDPAAYVPGPR